MKKIHLVCNAHIDPVWQWRWEEGAGAALSTFRTAAEICEENDGFIFCHNEAILYQFIEEYEQELFKRIQSLVKAGKWHILGGWYLQPDCNMPSGEGFVRQMLAGRKYFSEKFGVFPRVAVNFDSFGHDCGLVQLLVKGGYTGYVFMRPDGRELALPDDDFLWTGTDGSSIRVHRIEPGYNSQPGKAVEKIESWLKKYPEKKTGFIAWGVGNHGGGPSRRDIRDIAEFIEAHPEHGICHSTEEHYFEDLREKELPRFAGSLRPNSVGCYTSQQLIKQTYRKLENNYFRAEKMAAASGLSPYPAAELNSALTDLLTAQFHDTLPGTSIRSVEKDSLRIMHHGLEILSRITARAFFALCAGQPKAENGMTPILAYNPHPYELEGIFSCEFMLEEQHWDDFARPVLYQNGKPVPCQNEQAESNMTIVDWRKRVSFYAKLRPFSMNRFDAGLELLPEKPPLKTLDINKNFVFTNERIEVVINTATGLIDSYCVDGENYLSGNALRPVLLEDGDDPWGMTVKGFSIPAGEFVLADGAFCAKAAGVRADSLPPVRIVEDGPVRTVVEAMFVYGASYVCQRYILPKQGAEIGVELITSFAEPGKMLKLSVPTPWSRAEFSGQSVCGSHCLEPTRKEMLAHKWAAAHSGTLSLTCINDGTYGLDCYQGEIRVSLLRGCAYTAHPNFNDKGVFDTGPYMPKDRHNIRPDQDIREMRFWIQGGETKDRMKRVDREAQAHNEKPYILSYFPPGTGEQPPVFAELSGDPVVMTTFKKAENGEAWYLRLLEPTGRSAAAKLTFPGLGVTAELSFRPSELKTLMLDMESKTIREAPMLEEII